MQGLEGVVLGTTRLSGVNGAQGRLILAGYRVEDLVELATFEQVLGLLLTGELPEDDEAKRWRQALADARVAAWDQLAPLDFTEPPDPMVALRGRLARFEAPDQGEAGLLAHTAAMAVSVGLWTRRQAGLPPVPPDPTLSHAEDLLRMIRGQAPKPEEAAVLDGYLVTVADHGMNASTFTARVVASTGSDLTSGIVAALGALKGPLHGGAPGPVLDMLDACAAAGDVRLWLAGELAAGRRLMGMGHRVYRVRDPRAAALETVMARLGKSAESGLERLQLARQVEQEARSLLAEKYPERSLEANVEFYTALLLEALRVDRRVFTALFACSRVAGWCCHSYEQVAEGRLLRPLVQYRGGEVSARGAAL